MHRGITAGLAAAVLLAVTLTAAARAPQPDRAGIVREWVDERARGNVDAALARLDGGAWFIDGTCLVSRPCRGPAAVRPILEQQAAGRTADAVVYARVFGSVVVGRLDRRSDALRAAAVRRITYGFIAQVPEDKLSAWAVLPDLSDATTVKAELGPGAAPVTAFGDRVSVDRRFADAVTRGDVEGAVNIFTDDGLFVTPAGCLPVPCARPEIRGRLRANAANHAVYTFTNGQTVGSIVIARFELRADNIRAKGVERIINVYIAQVPHRQIAAWIQFPDLTDPDTVKFFGPY